MSKLLYCYNQGTRSGFSYGIVENAVKSKKNHNELQ